jgi:hypothetical protein
VNEDVVAAVTTDESVALVSVEKLHGASSQCTLFSLVPFAIATNRESVRRPSRPTSAGRPARSTTSEAPVASVPGWLPKLSPTSVSYRREGPARRRPGRRCGACLTRRRPPDRELGCAGGMRGSVRIDRDVRRTAARAGRRRDTYMNLGAHRYRGGGHGGDRSRRCSPASLLPSSR